MTSQNRIVRCVASTRYSLSGSANGHALAAAALVAALLMVKLSGDISALLSLALLGGAYTAPCRIYQFWVSSYSAIYYHCEKTFALAKKPCQSCAMRRARKCFSVFSC